MPVVEKLDHQIELRFYRQAGMSASSIFSRRESRRVDYQPRGGLGQTTTRVERARYLVNVNADIEQALIDAEVTAPVRIYDNGREYVVTGLEETERTDRVIIHGEAFPSAQR